MDHYPEWLGHDLVAGSLPWEQALSSSLAGFLGRFTLRDSHWIGLYHQPVHGATLLLRWDPREAEIEQRFSDSPPVEWLLLAVRFDGLERMDLKLRERRIATAVSGATSRAADVHRTHLEDRRGGVATMLHAPNVRLLCLTPDRAPLTLAVPAETL
ncbi:MAG: hypothetical protein H0T68_04645 [Gemmatimonadales bacterium]|nr:hypothetical protein [Gemmatimonadales bacterium]MBA3555014.1 hypothetical protein [Gemmatimonadales bacterium]